MSSATEHFVKDVLNTVPQILILNKIEMAGAICHRNVMRCLMRSEQECKMSNEYAEDDKYDNELVHEMREMNGGSLAEDEPWILCPVCNGEGKTVNPNIDDNGLTEEDFREDPDFAEDYKSGVYDITCNACHGLRVVKPRRIEELQQNAEDRRLAARENGDFESYCGAGDWRHG
jgi:hypothetical protein